MKKLFGMVVLLFSIYFVYNFLFVYFDGGHNIDYQLSDDSNIIYINEVLRSGNSNDKDNYSLKINIDDVSFNIQTFYDFGRSSNIVSMVKYYSGSDTKCIFIKYRNDKILNDIVCLNEGVMTPYSNLTSVSETLATFASSMEKYGYNSNNWKDDTSVSKNEDNVILYPNNLVKNHYVGVSGTTGFYRINTVDEIENVNIYKDIVDDGTFLLKGFINDKYISANYSGESLNEYTISNIDNSDSVTFDTTVLSNSTYVIGSYSTSLYLYDPVNKKEYELDYANKTVLEIGNADTNILTYKKGEWKRISIDSDSKDFIFDSVYLTDYFNVNYDKIVKVGDNSGYYYLFKKVNSSYNVYRADINNVDEVTYLFSTDNINNMLYHDDYVYYVSNGSLKYYSDSTGNRTVIYAPNVLNISNVSIGLYVSK